MEISVILALLLVIILACGVLVNPLSVAADYDLVKKWGSFGTAPGLFNEPADVAVDPLNEAVYVSDLENNRIQKFDSNGNYITSWGTFGTGPGEFKHLQTFQLILKHNWCMWQT